MKKSFARVLSIALAVALVITCAITGLVMPTAANTESAQSVTTTDENLFAKKNITLTLNAGQSVSSGGVDYALAESLVPGARYAVRFEAKGNPISVSPYPGGWGWDVKTVQSDDWRSYQAVFTVATGWNVEEDSLWVSYTPQEGGTITEGVAIELRNVKLVKAPLDGTFNLIADPEMNIATSLFTRQLANGHALITTDPMDPNNSVLAFTKDITATTSYMDLSRLNKKLSSAKILKFRFKVFGRMRFTNYANLTSNGYCYNPSATSGSGTQHQYFGNDYGWTTVEYFIQISTNWDFLQFVRQSNYVFVDDLEVYEVDVATSWKVNKTAALSATQQHTGNYGDTAANVSLDPVALVTEPANSFPYGFKNGTENKFTWALVDGTGNDSTGTQRFFVSETGLTRTTFFGNTYSLSEVKPQVTVTDGNKTETVNVEWDYMNGFYAAGGSMNVGSITTNGTNFTKTAGAGEDGSPALVASVTKSYNSYLNGRFAPKPNALYRITFKVKTTDATIQVRSAGNWKDVTLETAPTVNTEGKWQAYMVHVKTGAAPRIHQNSTFYFQTNLANDATAGEVVIDDVYFSLVNENSPLVLGGDFDTYTNGFKVGSALSVIDAAKAEEGNIGGNTSKVLKVNAGQAVGTSTAISQDYFDPYGTYPTLKEGKAYKVTFKHYGGAATFDFATWLGDAWLGGAGTVNCKESTEWTEYSVSYVLGSYKNGGNDPYRMRLAAANATTDAYFDDIEVTEIKNTVYAPYSNAEMGVGHSDNFWISGVDAVTGESYSGQRIIPDASIGTKLYFSFVGNGKVIPIPSSLKVHYEDGTVVPILNTKHTPMTGSAGDQFGPIEVREGTAYIEYNFAPETTGYQWGTLGSAVRRDVETEEVNGIRFLNRLYMNGLDWENAEGFTVTIDGKAWTVKEIGALARVATNDGTELDVNTATKRGLCYAADGNGVVRVTDYTKRYFDFTVVIPVDAADYDTEYEFGAYMVLTDGTTEETVYTEAMTDSVTAALGRGA